MENMVAQMLTCAGHRLFIYSNSSRNDSASRMELDFLIRKSKVTNRHNIIAIEVKSGKNYTLSYLHKAVTKYKDYLSKPVVVHTSDLSEDDNFLYLPVYMVPLLH